MLSVVFAMTSLVYPSLCNRTFLRRPLKMLIVSITTFSIAIGSPRTYLPRNRRPITWVSDYRCPIWTFSNWTPVIGYPSDFHVNYARFNGFLSNVFYIFQNLGKALRTFLVKKVTYGRIWLSKEFMY